MSTVISKAILEQLPSSLRQAISKMSETQQVNFEEDYNRLKKSKAVYFLIALLFPIQHFLLGKTGLGIIFILTAGGFWIWWLIEVFYTPLKRIPEYNEDLARRLLRDAKIMAD